LPCCKHLSESQWAKAVSEEISQRLLANEKPEITDKLLLSQLQD
jgi:hypothetical protein